MNFSVAANEGTEDFIYDSTKASINIIISLFEKRLIGVESFTFELHPLFSKFHLFRDSKFPSLTKRLL